MLLTRWSIEDLELRKLREMGDIEGPNSGDRLRLLRSSDHHRMDGWARLARFSITRPMITSLQPSEVSGFSFQVCHSMMIPEFDYND